MSDTLQTRSLVVGLVITVTLVAFEALAIATVMPEVKDDIGGLGLYGWVFSGFLLASLVGIVVAGELADRRSLAVGYSVGMALFAAGLVIGGLAGSMPVLVAGRVLQGFGAGAVPATAYAAIGRAIPSAKRPKLFAVLSTAWVVPGLVGPAAALAIEHALSWRAVFLILVPLVVVAAVLTIPALVALGPPVGRSDRGDIDDHRIARALQLVAGVVAIFVAGSVPNVVATIVLVGFGALAASQAVVHLLPKGTVRLAPGVPAAVAVRGILTFAFFAADAYVPLAVVDGRSGDAWIAGVALTVASLAWATGAWVQARIIDRVGPRRLDRTGFAFISVAAASLLAVALGAPLGLTIAGWAVGGLGMGLAYAPLTVTVLAAARPGEEGAASAAIQLGDALGLALGTGVSGWIIAFGDRHDWTVAHGVTVVFAVSLVVAIAGVAACSRLPAAVPDQAT